MATLSIMNATQIDVGKLPVVPQVLLKLIEACHKVDVSYSELEEIIKQDASLCSKMLAVGNSPLFHQWKNVEDLNRLLVVLGVDTIKTIAITSVVQQFFSQFNADIGKQMGAFWKQSLTCAYMMKSLAKLTGYESTDEAYITGLLHNLGQLVYLRQYSDEYLEILSRSHTDEELDGQERERYGATGTEVGAYLLKKWTPESFVSDAILFQHEPSERIFDTQPLIKLLNLAHKLSDSSTNETRLIEEADRLYGLTQPLLDEMRENVSKQVKETAGAYGIKIDHQGDEEVVQNVDDENARLELAKLARGFALFGSHDAEPQAADDENGIWRALLLDLGILFGFNKAIAFKYSRESGQLHGIAASIEGEEQVRKVQIPLTGGRSLAAESALEKKIFTSFDEQQPELTSVLDQQLRRAFDSPQLACLPLTDATNIFGVLVVGIEDEKTTGFKGNKTLLTQFLHASVNRIASLRLRSQEQESMLEEQRALQTLKVNKLVHEANNPLGVIKNYLKVLSLKLSDDQSANEQLDVIRDEIDRVAGIVLRMRDDDDQQSINDDTVDINQLITDLIGLFRVSMFASHGIKDRLQLAPSLAPVTSHRNSLKQVLTNLMKNAVEAMPDGGELQVSTQDNVNLNGTTYVQVSIADTGPGLSADALSKLFSPIKSSKGKEHAGLGLTIAKNLVTDLDGSISCRNREKGGAEFIFILPRAEST